MGRATIAREIARLDAISRTRALSAGETCQLAKMINTERRYDSMRAANQAAAKKVDG